ncbi:Tnnc2 [Symbiodinium natans]|uniref:Calmodulin n=1 Tax=Symbiodinium natans TaxID=878477 RepID=A0A812PVH5_9DINO|nr:Tnnc2 [Symbiodinium natans]
MFVLKHLRNFHEYDTKGAGTISIPEMKAVLRTTTIGLTERELKTVLKQVDADGDGSALWLAWFMSGIACMKPVKAIVKPDCAKLQSCSPAVLECHLLYTDLFEGAAGEDGAVSLGQLQDFLQQHKMSVSEDRLTSIMKEVDDDDSGVLELDEFLMMLVKAAGIGRAAEDRLRLCRAAGGMAQEVHGRGKLSMLCLRAVVRLASAQQISWTFAPCARQGLLSFGTVIQADEFSLDGQARELASGGVPGTDVIDVIMHPQIAAAGWDCRHAKEAGFHLADLASAGASIRNMRTAGFTDVASVIALRKRGVQAWKLKLGGFTLSDLRSGGYSSAELRLAGFSSASIAALEKNRAWVYCKANPNGEE